MCTRFVDEQFGDSHPKIVEQDGVSSLAEERQLDPD